MASGDSRPAVLLYLRPAILVCINPVESSSLGPAFSCEDVPSGELAANTLGNCQLEYITSHSDIYAVIPRFYMICFVRAVAGASY